LLSDLSGSWLLLPLQPQPMATVSCVSRSQQRSPPHLHARRTDKPKAPGWKSMKRLELAAVDSGASAPARPHDDIVELASLREAKPQAA